MTTFKSKILNLLRIIRAPIVRFIKPKTGYMLLSKRGLPLEPISYKYGFDRGLPVDRYYIEVYMEEQKELIRGQCLEIHDSAYIRRFGGNQVTQADALDIDTDNKEANIYGDLRNLTTIADSTYDTLIITHTINMIDDFDAAIRECHRILKPGGWIVCTLPSVVGPVFHTDHSYWRFTTASAGYSFGKYFDRDKMTVKSYGNVLAGQAFWVGLAAGELTQEELDFNDPHYPVTVALTAQK